MTSSLPKFGKRNKPFGPQPPAATRIAETDVKARRDARVAQDGINYSQRGLD